MDNQINVLIVTDGKPGHLSNSLGVLKSFERNFRVSSCSLTVRLRLKLLRVVLRLLLNHFFRLSHLPHAFQVRVLALFYIIDCPERIDGSCSYDWVISTGGDTSFINAWLSDVFNARNVYCSSLRGLNPSLFTLLVTTNEERALPNEIGLSLAPVPVDRLFLSEAGAGFRTKHGLLRCDVWTLLVGGNGAGCCYTDSCMLQLAQAVVDLASRVGVQILVTTSRRTGLQAERVLQSVFESHPSVSSLTLYNQKPEKVLNSYLGASDCIFCTVDSGSMISESIAAGKPVYVLVPLQVKRLVMYEAFLKRHVDARRIKLVQFGDIAILDIDRDIREHFRLLPRDTITELAERLVGFGG